MCSLAVKETGRRGEREGRGKGILPGRGVQGARGVSRDTQEWVCETWFSCYLFILYLFYFCRPQTLSTQTSQSRPSKLSSSYLPPSDNFPSPAQPCGPYFNFSFSSWSNNFVLSSLFSGSKKKEREKMKFYRQNFTWCPLTLTFFSLSNFPPSVFSAPENETGNNMNWNSIILRLTSPNPHPLFLIIIFNNNFPSLSNLTSTLHYSSDQMSSPDSVFSGQ